MMRRGLVFLVGLFCVLGLAAPARAATPTVQGGAPFYGDITGDGIPDRLSLDYGYKPTCFVTVEKGRANGTFGKPVDHALKLTGNPPYCPDIGAVGSFTKRGVPQLALAYFLGTPPGFSADNLFVLQNYQQVDVSTGLLQPSYLLAKDFDDDGYTDVLESADQDEGLIVSMSVHKHLTGTIRIYSDETVPNLQYADLDNTGNTDILVGYHVLPAPPVQQYAGDDRASVLDTKTGVETVLVDDQSSRTYVVSPIDYNGDKHLDVLVTGGGGPDRIFVNHGHDKYTLVTP